MIHTIYFTDKSVIFTDEEPSSVPRSESKDYWRSKVVKNLETANSLRFVVDDADAALADFAAQFLQVEAAGGVVRNGQDECLMIYRRGRWDLPKGHIEQGESPEVAAVRETAEETGVEGVKIVGKLCNTLHAYNVYGEWELKRTHWFSMRVEGSPQTKAQTQEQILKAEWCDRQIARRNAAESYPTVEDVFRKLEKLW